VPITYEIRSAIVETLAEVPDLSFEVAELADPDPQFLGEV